MLSTTARPAAGLNLFASPATSLGTVPLKLMANVESSLPSLPFYHQVPPKEEPDPDVPSSKRQKKRIGDKAVMEFMQSFRKERGLDSKPVPVPQVNGKQVVVNKAPTSNQFEGMKCGKSFSSNQALGGHVSSNHYVREDNGPKQQGNHECKVCHKSFTSGQALGGHKRVHYDGPPIITKRKASSMTPSSQQNFPTSTGCMKSFREEPNQFRDMQESSHSPTGCAKLLARERLNQLTEINLDLTL